MKTKLQSLLSHSLLVGIICTFLGIGGTYWFTTKYKELSYVIEPSEVFLKNPTTNDVEVSVNGVPVKEVFSHRIKIWNSGNLPIKDVSFTFLFPVKERNGNEFKILNLSYSTVPKHKFGKVEEEKNELDSMGMHIELLNPGDEVNVSIITNQSLQPEFYSKTEGVIVSQGSNSREKWNYTLLIISGLVIAFILWIFRIMLKIDRNVQASISTMKKMDEAKRKLTEQENRLKGLLLTVEGQSNEVGGQLDLVEKKIKLLDRLKNNIDEK